jgi:hypothetical protein
MPLTGGRAARPDAIDMGWMGAIATATLAEYFAEIQ